VCKTGASSCCRSINSNGVKPLALGIDLDSPEDRDELFVDVGHQPLECGTLHCRAREPAERVNPAINAHAALRGGASGRSLARAAKRTISRRAISSERPCRDADGTALLLGNRALRDLGFRSPFDTPLGARFRSAGFITLGKTNLPEFGMQTTTQPLAFGATHNPWDLDRSTSGASGGSCAAVAAGMVPVAHANDGGGSIRLPAAWCGLVGLKPSRGRVSDPLDMRAGRGKKCSVPLSL
jgi:hypothetical protein